MEPLSDVESHAAGLTAIRTVPLIWSPDWCTTCQKVFLHIYLRSNLISQPVVPFKLLFVVFLICAEGTNYSELAVPGR